MGKQTVLFQTHLDHGAKMVDFAGWDLPIHYGSQINEHLCVREDAGIFDVSHMTVLDLQGKDVQAFLQKLLANDIAKLAQPGSALYSCMLNEEGGVIDDLIVYYLAKNMYRLVFNASTRDVACAWITMQMQRYDIELTLRDDLAMIAVQGPEAIAKLESVLSPSEYTITKALKPFHTLADGDLFIARTGYTGEEGVEVLLPQEKAPAFWAKCIDAGVKPCGLGARDTLRLEAGLNLYGVDMDVDTTPLEAHLGWTVCWRDDSREFIGKAALAAQKQNAHPVLVGLVLKAKGVLRNHLKVFCGNTEGEITSGSYSPILQCGMAMARFPHPVKGACEVEVRGKRLPAEIVSLPFVKNGQSTLIKSTKELQHE